MIKAVIIDDIEQARLTFRKDLETYAPDVEVIAEAGGVVEGQAAQARAAGHPFP